ncbi:MAG: triose-phosphate isomerase, partial [Rikenellaceae bacterium]
MRKKIVAGNWKMNTTPAEGVALAEAVVEAAKVVAADVTLVVAPPFTHLAGVGSVVAGTNVALSSQNCADQTKGAYTGEVSAEMVKAIGAEYVILGHSERREYYGETSETLNKKMALS